MNLGLCGDILESVQISGGVVRMKHGYNWGLILLRCRCIPSRLPNQFLYGMFHTPGLILHHHDENENCYDEIEVHLLRYLKKNYYDKKT
jgi:hypothetical protein